MSDFWASLVASDNIKSINVSKSLAVAKQSMQSIANEVCHWYNHLASSRDNDLSALPLETCQTRHLEMFLPLLFCRYNCSEAEYIQFTMRSYVDFLTMNVAIQQIPGWRLEKNDNSGWSSEELKQFYSIHDAKFTSIISPLFNAPSWDSMPVRISTK
jgi:hypothetical protein